MERIWQVKEKKFDDPIVQILYNRGIIKDSIDKNAIDNFLQPDFDRDFHDPKLLPDIKPALSRIKKAIDSKEKIGIFADYDADGIPGAAFLYKTFGLFGIKPEVYIPTRQSGYGFNQSGIDRLIKKGCRLIISVDLGIKETKFAKYIKSKKVDLIITDHHLPGDELPEALAVINPKINGSEYPFKELSGGGVVYKLVQGLKKIYPEMITESFLKWNLDLIAISTVSDVVPLVDENRLIAKYGLLVLSKAKNIGIDAICKLAGINQNKINAYSIGFQIGPRINAPGRIDLATGSFKILISDEVNEVFELAKHLEDQNQKRQNSMEKIFAAVSRRIEKENLTKNKIIILSDPDWPKGVIGPVASRLLEKYFRPVILFREEEKILVGSARSIKDFNIVDGLLKVKKHLISFGGHSAAAGVQVKKENFQKFSFSITQIATEEIPDEYLLPKIDIDLKLEKNKISIRLFQEIENFEPFGMGNPKPIFITKSLRLKSHRLVGKENNHLQLVFTNGINDFKAISFNSEIVSSNLKTGSKYDIVYNPGINYWNGKNFIDLRLIDLKIGDQSGK